MTDLLPPFDLHPSVAYVHTVLENLEARTGRDLTGWVGLARNEGPQGPKERIAWLKAHGLGSTQAGLVSQRVDARPGHAFDDSPEGYLAAAPGYVLAQYAGRKAGFLPLFLHLVRFARSLGPEVKICPCETLVPFYRHHVFAQVKPLASRLDLGLALGDPTAVRDPEGHLKDTGGFGKKDRITHQLALTSASDLGMAEAWLRQAHAKAGGP